MKKLLLLVMLVAGVRGFSQKQKSKHTPVNLPGIFAQTITAPALREKLSVIASAAMEGRETASRGQRMAATYIEDHFRKLGLLPGTPAGYQMHFPIYQDTLIEAGLKVNGKLKKLDENFSLDIASANNGTFSIRELVFASYGVVDSARNDYKNFDVKGKWVLIFEGGPGSEERKGAFSTAAKLATAKTLGANGIFIMSSDFPKKAASETKGRMFLDKPVAASFPVIYVSATLAHELLGLDPAQLLESITNVPTGSYTSNIQFIMNKRTLMLQSSNVLAVLPGTDKKDEYLIITSHYDHIGKKGNEIFYGADDDGSGTTGVLQLAEAFAKAKIEGNGPRRSIVFMTVSGEEKGLLGSKYYSQYPSYPLSKTTANLNIDMVGRIDPSFNGDSLNYIYIIGDDKLSSDLRPITDSVNNLHLNLQLDRRFNDLKDPNRFYYRSDHYNFAKNGVPVIFYFNGTHADYHRSTDTVDKINFDLMSKRLKLVFHTSWEIANRTEMLKRDIPLQQ